MRICGSGQSTRDAGAACGAGPARGPWACASVYGDVKAVEPGLVAVDRGPASVGCTFDSAATYLAALERQAGLEGVAQRVVASRLAVGGDDLGTSRLHGAARYRPRRSASTGSRRERTTYAGRPCWRSPRAPRRWPPMPLRAAARACGLLVGDPDDRQQRVIRFVPCRNGRERRRLHRAPGRPSAGRPRCGGRRTGDRRVMHSHTTPTPIPRRPMSHPPDPSWHYVIVSLRDDEPTLQSYRIVDGTIAEARDLVR